MLGLGSQVNWLNLCIEPLFHVIAILFGLVNGCV